MSNSNGASGGIGMCGALFVLFLGLKLCKVIDWSWWWVFAPIWIPASIALVSICVILVVAFAKGR